LAVDAAHTLHERVYRGRLEETFIKIEIEAHLNNLRGDEDLRQPLTDKGKFLLKFACAYKGQFDIKNKALRRENMLPWQRIAEVAAT